MDFAQIAREAAENARKRQANGHAADGGHQLATIWADDYELNLDAGGVVDGLIPRTGKTVLYGESGCGKTFAAIDLACHVAAGMPWRGLEVEQGVVIYVAAEAPESVKRRLWAWKRHHGVDRLPVVVVQSSVDLLNGDAAAVVELVETVTCQHGRVALVVVDTLARAMTGNENTPDDMGKFVAACSRIGEAGGTHVLIVHHCGKDAAKGARGHSSLRAATDVELEVTNGEGGGCIKVTKSRDEAGGQTFGFRLKTVELGTNAKDRVVNTCVAMASDAPAKPAREEKLTARQHNALRCLGTALADHGKPAPHARDIPHQTRVVRVEDWLRVTGRYLPGDDGEPEWRRKGKLKALGEVLRAKGKLRFADGYYWLPSPISPISPNLTSEGS